jgi:hypothetical protein
MKRKPPPLAVVEAARASALARGWPWVEPIEARRQPHPDPGGAPVWELRTNTSSRGQNVRILIREADLTILTAGYLPR